MKLALLLVVACMQVSSGADKITVAEDHTTMTMKKSLDRPGPPDVAPVTIGSVRYEQAFGGDEETELESGFLRAVDTRTEQRLWLRRIYTPKYDPTRERDVQERYFTGLAVGAEPGTLVVTNEDGETWIVDADTGEAKLAE